MLLSCFEPASNQESLNSAMKTKSLLVVCAAALLLSAVFGQTPRYPERYLDNRSTPAALIHSLYNAINRKEYARAYSYWQPSAPLPSYRDFAQGFLHTASVRVELGKGVSEGAAGSSYTSLPVRLFATDDAGEVKVYEGCYTLRFVTPGIQDPPFIPLHIQEGKLHLVRRWDDAPPRLRLCAS